MAIMKILLKIILMLHKIRPYDLSLYLLTNMIMPFVTLQKTVGLPAKISSRFSMLLLVADWRRNVH